MMRRAFLLSWLLVFFLTSVALADPGMWLFEAFPSAKVKAKYGFDPTAPWLEHVRLSSVRFNNGGSGSFVSADGLTFTNHHIAAECIQQLSTAGKDYMKTGFFARTQAEELKCPAYELNQLVGIEDVTAQVKGAVKAGMPAAAARRDVEHREPVHEENRPALRRGHPLFGRGLSPLPVQEVHRRTPGVRARVRRRLFRG